MRPRPANGGREPPQGVAAAPDRSAGAALPEPAARTNLLLCLAALGVILFVQIQQEAVLGSLLLVLVGLLGVLSRLRVAPIVFLLVLAVQQLLRQVALTGFGRRRFAPAWSPDVTDVLLCGAVLAYVVAHYRLQSLVHYVVPVDPRRREGPPRWHFWRLQWVPRVVQERRSPRAVSRLEAGLLVMSLPAAPLLAHVFWAALAPAWTMLDLPARLWRVLLVAWALGLALLLATAVLRQVRRRRMTPQEAAQLLQDVVWQETRREQRRLNRWLAWARLRRRPRKEFS